MARIVFDPAPITDTPPKTFSDSRGVVYVEFLIAFMPLFLLFLGICQLTLLTAARLIVSHAAVTAARSAIVVLEDPVDAYDGAPRGSLSEGRSSSLDLMPLLSQLGAQGITSALSAMTASDQAKGERRPQQGARMAAIRWAAIAPLMALAPSESSVSSSNESLDRSLVANTGTQMAFAYGYTGAAAAITIHSSESSEQLATEPLEPKGMLTVRVTYLYYCGVPVVRALMCHSLSGLLDTNSGNSESVVAQRLKTAADPSVLQRWITGAPRYVVLTGQATLPNQGADYVPEEGKQ